MKPNETAGGLLRRWLSTLWTGARCKCPRCREGKMFKSFFTIKKKCEHCGVTFQPYEGDVLGVIAVGYFGTVIPSLVALVLAYAYLDLSLEGYFLLYFTVMSTVLLGFYRNFKGLWVAFVYLLTGLKPRL